MAKSTSSRTAAKRDNNYYIERLELEAQAKSGTAIPAAGKFSSPAEAFRAAGLKKARSRLSELKNAWNKATPTEQRAFLGWLAVSSPSPMASAKAGPAASALVAPTKQRPSEDTKREVSAILARRSIKPGQAMVEMGFNRLNPSLGLALTRGTCLQPEVLDALGDWIRDNSR